MLIWRGRKKLAPVFRLLAKALKSGDQRVSVGGSSRVEPSGLREQGSAEICKF
jgi:hypothetical protein